MQKAQRPDHAIVAQPLKQDGGERAGLLTGEGRGCAATVDQMERQLAVCHEYSKILVPVFSRRRDNRNFVRLGTTRHDQLACPAERFDDLVLGCSATTELCLGVRFGLTTPRMAEFWVQFNCSFSVSIECHSIDVLPAKTRNSLRQQGATKTNPHAVTGPNTQPAFFNFAIAAAEKFALQHHPAR